MESKVINWLSDGRNLLITLLAAAVAVLSVLVTLAAFSAATAPSPYERKDAAEAARAELRDRINAELANQTIINRDLYSQLDDLRMELSKTQRSKKDGR